MKVKRLKVLLPALTGMLLTNGTISPISNNNVEIINKRIDIESLYNKRKENGSIENDEDYLFSKTYGEVTYNIFKSESSPFSFTIDSIYEDEKIYTPFSVVSGPSINIKKMGISYENKIFDRSFIDRERDIVYVDLNSKFLFNESSIISIEEEVQETVEGITKFRVFTYNFGNVIYDSQHNYLLDKSKIRVKYFRSYNNKIEIDDSYEECFNKFKKKIEETFYSLDLKYYKKTAKLKINVKDILKYFKPNYEFSSYLNWDKVGDIEYLDYTTDGFYDELIFSGYYDCDKYVRSASNLPMIISSNYDLRNLIYDCNDSYDLIVGSIKKVIGGKNLNDSFPIKLYINYDVLDKDTLDYSHSAWLVLENLYLIENFNFLFNNKKLNNDEEISISYSSKMSMIRDILMPYQEYFNIYIDNKFVDFNSSELQYNTFLTLGYISKSLVEFHPKISSVKMYSYFYPYASFLIKNRFSFYLDFYDDIGPAISGDIKSFRTSDISNFKIDSYNFKALDEKDGDVSESIELIEEEGKYFIKAKDAAGNESKKEILLDIDPILYENINVINDEKIQVPENILLTKKRFEKILTKIHGVEPQDVDIIPYVNNCKIKGTYKVSYKINEETKEMDFEVVDPIKKNPEPGDVADQINEAKDSFIAKVKTFFNKLGNWFRGVFTKWKFDCFITNEQWDIRFN